jgi:2-polyprenyl-6-methoxyphenol hydroxylase-like FAD-dependent oxidoreductase
MEANYDVITVGGGLAGSTLARSLALAGKKVLVVEGETQFRDRIRGEEMASWGVAEARELGVLDLLLEACAHEIPKFQTYLGPDMIEDRDLRETTPQACPNLGFFHPAMQECLLGAAATAGTEVIRGAHVRNVEPGQPATVTFERNGLEERATARLVVGCDGRNSSVRRWAGFGSTKDPDFCQISGLFMEDVASPEDAAIASLDPGAGVGAILFPQGGGRVRTYVATRVKDGRRFSGERDVSDYLALLAERIPGGPQFLKGARASGPLATFNGAASYVQSPYREGVGLVGDAAGTSDPAWGQGLSLTLRDVRAVRDALLATDDWDAACRAYADEHDRHFGALKDCEQWFTTMFFDDSPEAEAIRERAMPLIAEDETRMPDTMQSGPDAVPVTEQARRRFFGEE